MITAAAVAGIAVAAATFLPPTATADNRLQITDITDYRHRIHIEHISVSVFSFITISVPFQKFNRKKKTFLSPYFIQILFAKDTAILEHLLNLLSFAPLKLVIVKNNNNYN